MTMSQTATKWMIALLVSFTFSSIAEEKSSLPSKGQRLTIYNSLIDEIERVDAIGIATRNTYKTSSWPAITKAIRKEFEDASSWSELRLAITNLHNGFTNAHSYIRPGPLFPETLKAEPRNSDVYLRFTYPNIDFFQESDEIQQAVNKQFAAFSDLHCRYPHEISCAHLFVREFHKGEPKAQPSTKTNFVLNKRNLSPAELRKEDCRSLHTRYGQEWLLSFSGSSLCVLERSTTVLVKIKLFATWGQNSMYCGPNATAGSACDDIYGALKTISRIDPEYLILDVQNNRGGSENTPYIAAFATEGFFDLQVQYKKIRELENSKLRRELFYNNRAAETWFADLIASGSYSKIQQGHYLPARSDFCRGAEDCSRKPIKRHILSRSPQKGVILTNGNCVSSCDDIVWRLKETNGWKVVGQTPVTDGAYARIEGGIFLHEDGQVTTQTWGDGGSPEEERRMVIRYRVPVSRTVDRAGTPLEGNASVLDIALPHDQDQFFDNDAYLANSAFVRIRELTTN